MKYQILECKTNAKRTFKKMLISSIHYGNINFGTIHKMKV